MLDALASWSIVIFKKHLGAYAIYAGSDFDIEAAVLDARAKMTGLDFGRLRSVAMLQPILAKRFYHKTGSLLWFDVDIAPLSSGVETVKNFKPAQRLDRPVPASHRHDEAENDAEGETYSSCGVGCRMRISRSP